MKVKPKEKKDFNLKETVLNQVLDKNYSPSKNFFSSDLILQSFLKKELTKEGFSYMSDKLFRIGKSAATEMNPLSMDADKNGPVLVKRNALGQNINEIKFHPSYWQLMDIAVKTEMFRAKWEPKLREKFSAESNRLGFSTGFLFAMSEMGQYCPLCMTDGAARLINLHCKDEDKERLLKHIYTDVTEYLFTGAMFLTEKTGGSDVGANQVTASQIKGDLYHLNGEKWFCSNANADIIFVLARTDAAVGGTKGLSIFLVEKHLKDGSKNPIEIIRIKDKLGVRSMASAECLLTNTIGKLVGNEFQGFSIMTDMINLSRIYTAMGSLAGSRRAIIEAYQFLNHRQTFGKNALDHALIRDKFREIGSLYVGNFYLVWRTVRALDRAENGDAKEEQLLRMLTPMIKKQVSEEGVYLARESMELMGGIGYIEDTVIPRILRDLMVNPIWEGSGNIMILDMLRASMKSKGLEIMTKHMQDSFTKAENCTYLLQDLNELIDLASSFGNEERDSIESAAKPLFENLTKLYQISVLLDALNKENETWINPTIDFLKERIANVKPSIRPPLSKTEIAGLISWNF